MDLLQELKKVVGDRATNDPAELYCYSCDASYIKGLPEYVAIPKNTREVADILRIAYRHGIAITPRGAGTGLTGGAVPLAGGIVLDMSRMDKILGIELENLQVLVEPGVIPARLNEALAPYGFFFPPDPGSADMCTLGGLIANSGSGMRAVKYGTVRDYVLDLEVVLPDGSIIHTGSRNLKSASGYDLTQLFIGSEGTLGVITSARLRIHPLPQARAVVLAYFSELDNAGRAVVASLSKGILPSACEILDKTAILVLKEYDPKLELVTAEAMLIFELDGVESTVGYYSERIIEVCSSLGAFYIEKALDEISQRRVWAGRRLVGVAISRLNPNKTRVYIGEDIAVPLRNVPSMLRKIREISRNFHMQIMTWGHIGDGNLHTGMAIDTLNDKEWEQLHKVGDAIHRAALELGGTVTGEHGIGRARGVYMDIEHGKSFEVMVAVKKAIDKKNIMNPLKIGM